MKSRKSIFGQRKGQFLNNLTSLAIGIAVLGIVLTVAFLIMSQGQEQVTKVENPCSGCSGCTFNQSTHICHNSTGDGVAANTSLGHGLNSTGTLAEAIDDIPGWVPIIIIAVVGAVLLGLVALFRRQ